MIRTLPLFLFATPALADAGLHHHPHGIEMGWVIAVLVGLGAGFGLSRAIAFIRRRK